MVPGAGRRLLASLIAGRACTAFLVDFRRLLRGALIKVVNRD